MVIAFRRIIGGLLIVFILFTALMPCHQVYAESANISIANKNIQISAISPNKVKVTENGITETLELRRTPDGKINQIIYENLSADEKEILTINGEAHTVHSSLTGRTEKVTPEKLNVFGIEQKATGDIHTYKFSFAKIKKEAGAVKTTTQLAKVLIKMLAARGHLLKVFILK